ncbi:MAG TPA: PIN domain-containing protein [Candidatus Bilamarchaeaceae archaeon]|nr:PIN domain-containing protein [Candidatus Bilamarchaeaceae archaeon]
MIVLDTSLLVSFYLTADVNHEKAIELVRQNKNETMLLSDIILFETLTVLNYKSDINLAKEAHEELLSNKQIRFFHLTEQEKDEILWQFFENNKKAKLSFAGISVIYMASTSNSKVLAFDEGILKALE